MDFNPVPGILFLFVSSLAIFLVMFIAIRHRNKVDAAIRAKQDSKDRSDEYASQFTFHDPKQKSFEREMRYLVIKGTDIGQALTLQDQKLLQHLSDKIESHRDSVGKPELVCAVVEADWSIYEDVWKLIESESK